MARSNLAAVETLDEGVTGQARRRGKRGPMQFYVEYQIVDGQGNPVDDNSGYKARFVRVEKDKASVTKRVLNGEAVSNLMVVTVPLNAQPEAEAA